VNRLGGLRGVGRALGSRNYRLFFAGQSISLIGTWLTRVATSWLVYRLTGSAWLLGVVGFAGQIPTFFLAPVAGVLVDRWDRHKMLVVTQILSLIESVLLAALAIPGLIQVWHLIALNVFQGLINAFDMPSRQSFMVEMVDNREDLPNAIALNSSMVNGARLIGPSAAGILIAWVGEGGCFAIDAVSYLGVIASLLAMRVKPKPRKAPRKVITELVEGFRYAAGFGPIRAVLILLALVSLMGMPYTVLMPVIAGKTLHGDAGTLGWLMALSGLGALGGALYLAARRTVLGLGKVIVLAASTFGVALIAFGLSRSLWLSLVLMVPVGAGMMIHMASSNTIVQTLVDEDKRGRVMSFYAMAFFGTAPFGSLLAGVLAERVGAPVTVMIGGAACIVGALLFATRLPGLRAQVRPIYRRMGILPEIAEGLQSAAQMQTPPED
jgi:MFS family permease